MFYYQTISFKNYHILLNYYSMRSIFSVLCLLVCQFSEAQTFTASGGDIPDDGSFIVFEIPVNGLPNATDTTTFGLESVCFDIFHPWSADLHIILRTPDGTETTLVSGQGGDQDGFVQTCLSGNAVESIFSAWYPFTGTFRPVGDMGHLNNGQNPNGTWQLIILDTYAFADAGNLTEWSITFGPNPCKPFDFKSSNLPVLKISTNGQVIRDAEKIDVRLEVLDNGVGQRNYLNQTDFAFSGKIGIELHGSSSQGFPKKSYRFEVRDSLGDDLEVPLLNMPATSDFVLTANFSDKTLMRNALTYKLSNELGQYASRTRFCEVMLNDTYQGVYLLTEKIKRGNDRLDLARLAPDDTTGMKLTGGYICRVDRGEAAWWSQFPQPNSTQYTFFVQEYPKLGRIQPAQLDYIQRFVDSFEVALAGADFQHPTLGWRRVANEKSFIDFLIINELSKNVDGYRLSTFFHKDRDDRGGRLTMGPVWDFDLAWYNADYCDNPQSSGWAYDINYVCQDAGVPFWWERLMQDSTFAQNLACRWDLLRQTTLSLPAVYGKIDSMAALVDESQARNFDFWPILGVYVWPNPGTLPDTYAGEIQQLKLWIAGRIDWLDSAIGDLEPTLNATFSAAPLSAFDWSFAAQANQPGVQFEWDFGDGQTALGALPMHTFSSPGTYTVRLRAFTAFGCSTVSEQILNIINTHSEEAQIGAIAVFPNPAQGRFYVRLPENADVSSLDFSLFDAAGHVCKNWQPTPPGEARTLTFDLPSGTPPGVYCLRGRTAGEVWVAKLVVE
jgi:hypothetical protein